MEFERSIYNEYSDQFFQMEHKISLKSSKNQNYCFFYYFFNEEFEKDLKETQAAFDEQVILEIPLYFKSFTRFS